MTQFLANKKVPYADVQREPVAAKHSVLCCKPSPSQRISVVNDLFDAMVAGMSREQAKGFVLSKYDREEVEAVAKLFERHVQSNETMFSVIEKVIVQECGGRYVGKASERYLSPQKSPALDALLNQISCIEYALNKVGLADLFREKSPHNGNVLDLLLNEGWKPISSLEEGCLVLFVKEKMAGHMGVGLDEKMLECKMSSANPYVAQYPVEAGRQICSPDHIIYLRGPEAQKSQNFIADKQVPYHELQLEPTVYTYGVWCCQPERTTFRLLLERYLGSILERVRGIVSKDFRGEYSIKKEDLDAIIQHWIKKNEFPKKDLMEVYEAVVSSVKSVLVDCDLTDEKNAREWKYRVSLPPVLAIIMERYGGKVIREASDKGINDEVSCYQYAMYETGSNAIVEEAIAKEAIAKEDPGYSRFPAHRVIDLFLKGGWVSTPVPEKDCMVLYIKDKEVVHMGVGLGDGILECKFSSDSPSIARYPIKVGWQIYDPDYIVYLRKGLTEADAKPVVKKEKKPKLEKVVDLVPEFLAESDGSMYGDQVQFEKDKKAAIAEMRARIEEVKPPQSVTDPTFYKEMVQLAGTLRREGAKNTKHAEEFGALRIPKPGKYLCTELVQEQYKEFNREIKELIISRVPKKKSGMLGVRTTEEGRSRYVSYFSKKGGGIDHNFGSNDTLDETRYMGEMAKKRASQNWDEIKDIEALHKELAKLRMDIPSDVEGIRERFAKAEDLQRRALIAVEDKKPASTIDTKFYVYTGRIELKVGNEWQVLTRHVASIPCDKKGSITEESIQEFRDHEFVSLLHTSSMNLASHERSMAALFNMIIGTLATPEKKLELMAEFEYRLFHLCYFERGSAACTEWIIEALRQAKCPSYEPRGHFRALAEPFLSRYVG